MQNFNTITGVLKLRLQGIPYTIIRQRFHVGDSTIRLLSKRYEELGIDFKEIANGDPAEVEEMFYPAEAAKRKECKEPDWEKCYQRIHAAGSKVNISFLMGNSPELSLVLNMC